VQLRPRSSESSSKSSFHISPLNKTFQCSIPGWRSKSKERDKAREPRKSDISPCRLSGAPSHSTSNPLHAKLNPTPQIIPQHTRFPNSKRVRRDGHWSTYRGGSMVGSAITFHARGLDPQGIWSAVATLSRSSRRL
jgi:hypothetical protein